MKQTFRTRDMPFDGTTNRLILYFCDSEDLTDACKRLGMPESRAKKILRQPQVKVEVEDRLERKRNILAEMAAQARQVTVQYLDTQLHKAVRIGADKGDTKALELAYDRIGLRRGGEFIGQQQPTDEGVRPPSVYRALERTTTLTQQVKELVVEQSLSSEVLDY